MRGFFREIKEIREIKDERTTIGTGMPKEIIGVDPLRNMPKEIGVDPLADIPKEIIKKEV